MIHGWFGPMLVIKKIYIDQFTFMDFRLALNLSRCTLEKIVFVIKNVDQHRNSLNIFK